MMFLMVLLFCGSVLCASSRIEDISHSENGKKILVKLSNNPIDDLWKKAFEVIRTMLKKHKPFQMPVQQITGDGISLTAKLNQVVVSKAENFVIDHIENNIFGLWAKFKVSEPAMHLEGDYIVTGTVEGRGVNGTGHFSLEIENLETDGYIKVAFQESYLQMSQLDIHYTIQNLTFNETGLEVDGMTHEQLEDLFQNSFLKYFQDNEKFVSTQVSTYVKEQANKVMYGKTLQQLLDWLKDFIDGKIIPTL